MTDNVVKTTDGIEIYVDNIYRYSDEYRESLHRKDKDVEELLRKPLVFKGMLKHIYVNVFKMTGEEVKYHNKNSRIDYSNVDLLNNIWDIYTDLCYKNQQHPTILNFSLMTGIAMDTFNDWKHGRNRASTSHSESYKKWLAECESAAYDSALSGNPGGMFILKSCYGYIEQNPQIRNIIENIPRERPQEIIERRNRQQQLPPPMPDFD